MAAGKANCPPQAVDVGDFDASFALEEDNLPVNIHISQEPGIVFLGVPIPILHPDLLDNNSDASKFMENFLMDKVNSVGEDIQRIGQLQDPQLEYLLLSNCLGLCKINHLLRGILSAHQYEEPLKLLDHFMNEGLRNITGLKLDSLSMRIASLPIRYGGLGTLRSKYWDSISFMSSLLSAKKMIVKIFFGEGFLQDDDFNLCLYRHFKSFSERPGIPEILQDLEEKQKIQITVDSLRLAEDSGTLCRKLLDKCHEYEFNELVNIENYLKEAEKVDRGYYMDFALKRSTFRAVKSPFLKAKPVGRTSMTGYQFRVAVRSILHQPVHGNEHRYNSEKMVSRKHNQNLEENEEDQALKCHQCNKTMTSDPEHSFQCSKNGDLIRRHNAIRDTVARYCRESGLSARLEEPNLLEDSQLRPADVFVPIYGDDNRPLALDISITNTIQSSVNVVTSVLKGRIGSAALNREKSKCDKFLYKLAEKQIAFKPLVIESYGLMGDTMKKFLQSLVAGQQSHVRLKPEYRLKRMFMELNVLLWKWNALKVEQCTPLNLRVGDY